MDEDYLIREEQYSKLQNTIQQRINELKNLEKEKIQLYQKIRSETDFKDAISVHDFQSKGIDIEDEVYNLRKEQERLKREKENNYSNHIRFRTLYARSRQNREYSNRDNISKINHIRGILFDRSISEYASKLNSIYLRLIPIPSNIELDQKLPFETKYDYGDNSYRGAYFGIIPVILQGLDYYNQKILGLKLQFRYFDKFEKSVSSRSAASAAARSDVNLNQVDISKLDNLVNRVDDLYKQYVETMNNFLYDYERIIPETYNLMSRAFSLTYRIGWGESLNYQVRDFTLNPDATMHVDLMTMKYYWGLENKIYDPRSESTRDLVISSYRLIGFDKMVREYRNRYNYLVGVYYQFKSKRKNNVSDLQVGITGSFNWAFDLRDYIEMPIFAAQREIYEETRMFFQPHHIIFKGKEPTETKKKKLVFSYVVDVNNAEFLNESDAKQIFRDRSRYQIFNEDKIYKDITLTDTEGVLDNRKMKVSVLLVGNDLRDVLHITRSEIRELNDNIRMVSCIGRNVNIGI